MTKKKNIEDQLCVENKSDLTIKTIIGRCNTNSPTKV